MEKRNWQACEVFVENKPNRIMVFASNNFRAPCVADCGDATVENKANAALIVQAVNNLNL